MPSAEDDEHGGQEGVWYGDGVGHNNHSSDTGADGPSFSLGHILNKTKAISYKGYVIIEYNIRGNTTDQCNDQSTFVLTKSMIDTDFIKKETNEHSNKSFLSNSSIFGNYPSTSRKLTTVFTTKSALKTAVNAWCSNSASATTTYGDINTWDVSAVTDMSYMFEDASFFNSNISAWDTSNVTDMSYMFYNARNFNDI